ncbi:MAG: type II toxin-antitoxin system RelE/ParE family toxin [Chthoniobacteraceae bacterium]
MTLEFLSEAWLEAEEATRYYEERVPGLGVRFRLQLENVCAAVSSQPLLWNDRPGGYRRVNLPGFPYYAAYVIRGDRVVVVAVGHTSRRPMYWTQRDE